MSRELRFTLIAQMPADPFETAVALTRLDPVFQKFRAEVSKQFGSEASFTCALIKRPRRRSRKQATPAEPWDEPEEDEEGAP